MKQLKTVLFTLIFGISLVGIHAQVPGDTIVVESFNFSDNSRDMLVEFPSNADLNFEKILLRYTMRCKDALVSTVTDRNLGCGEWDYSCNTYLVDSNKVEISENQIPSHTITNFSDLVLNYVENPVYDYIRETQETVSSFTVIDEQDFSINNGTESLSTIINTSEIAGKSQFLFTQSELLALGMTAGEINGFTLQALESSGQADFLKIKMQNTTKIDLSGAVALDGFTEVYYGSTTFSADNPQRFQFHAPFNWDGSSNVLVEFNFSNLNTILEATQLAGHSTTESYGLTSKNGSELLLAGNGYLECENYKGIGGAQNRTIETWIKGDVVGNGEICSWGTNVTSEKWTFRLLSSGEIRVEIAGTGTVSTKKVNDGKWHHVACVLNGNNASDIRFYIDGVLDVNSVTGSGVINTNAVNGINLRVNRGVNNRYFDGEIDDLRIWDTALTGETLQAWMRKVVDANHPNYSNLQLHYTFDENGSTILDQSGNGNNATIIGQEYRTSFADGASLFKDFTALSTRPNITFHQGTYDLVILPESVDRPITKTNQIFVSENTITTLSDDYAQDDIINSAEPTQYWLPLEHIYSADGTLIESNTLQADGTIQVSMLDYRRRFPFYNELVSFVTPYGIGVDFGPEGVSWIFDMTDYVHILKDKKRLLMTLGGQNQEEMDLDFLFIVGTPPRDILSYEQLWQGTNRQGNVPISSIVNDTKFTKTSISIDDEVEYYKLRSTITGHGSEGEFGQNGGIVNHRIFVNDNMEFQWNITQECSENPIYPQGGTWVYDRQGWCPGEHTLIVENDLTDLLTESEVSLDYSTSNPNDASGDYRYHVAHQLIGYGPANHELDAAIVEILAPNNTALYTRTGTICGNPEVRIKNTGSTELTELTISYWLNESLSPQTYVWTGNLGFMEDEVVEIPAPKELWMDLIDENNRFYAEISSPNQASDQYEFNNSYSSTLDVPQIVPPFFYIETRTNNNPNHNSYQLFDVNGEVIGANDLSKGNETTFDDYELEDGCYKLVFYDTNDDGISWWANPDQGVGHVKIIDEDGGNIITFNPDFGGGFEFSFNTKFVLDREELEFLTSIKTFPNPTSGQFTLQGKDLDNAQVHIIDAIGRTVEAPMAINGESIQFDLEMQRQGIYYVIVVKGDIKTSRKIVKL